MTKKEKVAFAMETLEKLYPEIPIPLDHKDPYTLLIAVLLSAQSTDVRVNQITPLLFARASTPVETNGGGNSRYHSPCWIVTNEI
jgi:endonuclease-3